MGVGIDNRITVASYTRVFLAFYLRANDPNIGSLRRPFLVFSSPLRSKRNVGRESARTEGADLPEILKNIASSLTRRSSCLVNHPKSRGYFSKRAQGIGAGDRLEKRAARMLRSRRNSERTATINARHTRRRFSSRRK